MGLGSVIEHVKDAAWNRRRIITRYGVRIDRRDPHIDWPVDRHLRAGKCEVAEITAVQVITEPQDRVVEVGAGLGIVTTLAARTAAHVTAFEANPAMRASLERTFSLNDVRPDLRMHAVAAQSAQLHFAVDSTFWTGRLSVDGVPVEAEAFTDVLEEVHPSFVILDCEGGERDLLADPLPGYVLKLLVEFHPDVIGEEACDALVAGLTAQGFAVRTDLSDRDVRVFIREPPS